MKVIWSAHAVSDLQNVSCYIEENSGLALSNRTTRAIYEAAQSLSSMPNRGRIGRVENTRELLVPRLPFIIVYQVILHPGTSAASQHPSRRAEKAIERPTS
jgi:toxin ParE1/3/4